MNQDPYAVIATPVSGPAPSARPTAPRSAPARAPAPRPQIRFADDRDAMIRTVLMEAGAEPPEGQQAVAAVIHNRARQRGLSPQQVVLEPNQFEPWGNPETASRGMAIRPDSPEYQRAASMVDQVLGGADPTNGADHFYAPKAQAALGRPAPSWASGEPLVIGGHNFYSLGGSDEAARTQAASGADPYAAISEPAQAQEPPLDLAALTRRADAPEEVILDNGIIREGGQVFTLNRDDQRVPIASDAEWDSLSEEERAQRVRVAISGRSPEFLAEYKASMTGVENVPPWLANLSQGNSLGLVGEVIGGVNYLNPFEEGADRGISYEAGRAAWRDRQAQLVQDDPVGSIGMQMLGGLLTPGLKGSGDWIGAASGTQRIGRAATVGAGYGGVAGLLGSEETDAESRLRGGLLGAGTGAVTGGVLDAGIQRATSGAAARLTNPSPARQLSREGVQLTPGQMLESTPLVGGMLRKTEDAATSIPIAGPSISAARTRGTETFNVAAYNRALAPIGQSLPRNTRPGYEAVEEVQRRLGQAYDDVLPEVSAQLDQPLYDDIAAVLDRAATEMPEDRLKQLASVLQNRVFRNVDESDATLTGQQFKDIESELGAIVRQFQNAGDPSVVAFSDAVAGLQGALREMVARQNPAQAARIRQINEGYANLVRIERAAGSSPAQATDGVFSATQLGVAANTGTGRSQRARGGGLLQDLASAGRQVLPSTVNNSGTADRAGILALATGGAAFANPYVTIPTIAVTAGAYTRPAQDALNAIYRATDQQAAFSALAELQRFAGRNPALQPYYQSAVEAVQRAFPSQSQEPAPTGRGLLAPTTP